MILRPDNGSGAERMGVDLLKNVQVPSYRVAAASLINA